MKIFILVLLLFLIAILIFAAGPTFVKAYWELLDEWKKLYD